MPEHGYSISSPCEPEGSGELKIGKIGALGSLKEHNSTNETTKQKK